MLYNQALLSRAFVEAWEATGHTRYNRAATRYFDYVARDMTTPGGAFYTAKDADNLDTNSKREEGEFYVWTRDHGHALKMTRTDGPLGSVGDTDDGAAPSRQ